MTITFEQKPVRITHDKKRMGLLILIGIYHCINTIYNISESDKILLYFIFTSQI